MNDLAIAEYANLDIVCEDAYILAVTDNAAFNVLRKKGFGGSDSGVLLGVNKWKNLPTLIDEKVSELPTEEELAVGKNVNVRKGADLEPIILNKAASWFDAEIYKPNAMYNIHDTVLNVNYDGIVFEDGKYIPVEAKYISPFAGKHWKWENAYNDGFITEQELTLGFYGSIIDYVNVLADLYGIPPYYLTQVQQEMLGLQAPYGYLAALNDKDWNLYMFKIYKDELIQREIIKTAEAAWKLVVQRRLNESSNTDTE